MKHIPKSIFIAIFLLACMPAIAQEFTFTQVQQNQEVQLDPNTGFPVIKDIPYVTFNEGIATNLITRIERQDTRSNFVYQNYLVGAFASLKTSNIQPVDSMLKLAVYYPAYNSFNGMKQKNGHLMLYAVDIFYGAVVEADMWKYVRIESSLGLHSTYQLTDEYHMVYFGAALLEGIELPVAKKWTVVANGTVTLDYANLGSNRNIQPFDLAWQYQFEVGIRYSKKAQNTYSYIH